ncbi:hypothetical protein GGF32_007060 [Allomyces javanicus]|nr:hypothetical protein GGF32_007060 [Allomyces javanicus]
MIDGSEFDPVLPSTLHTLNLGGCCLVDEDFEQIGLPPSLHTLILNAELFEAMPWLPPRLKVLHVRCHMALSDGAWIGTHLPVTVRELYLKQDVVGDKVGHALLAWDQRLAIGAPTNRIAEVLIEADVSMDDELLSAIEAGGRIKVVIQK